MPLVQVIVGQSPLSQAMGDQAPLVRAKAAGAKHDMAPLA